MAAEVIELAGRMSAQQMKDALAAPAAAIDAATTKDAAAAAPAASSADAAKNESSLAALFGPIDSIGVWSAVNFDGEISKLFSHVWVSLSSRPLSLCFVLILCVVSVSGCGSRLESG